MTESRPDWLTSDQVSKITDLVLNEEKDKLHMANPKNVIINIKSIIEQEVD
jgi:hypothetical protein